ncbi:hypothetical protein LOZ80_00975 [Paenibacillus sp. HWE-109]|uniref:hypothetical protein n=1 Tax=Paenibacillus sp. HWE-109 TaxID=1306526 RepID=UPI001EE00C56|nr:hypothetical protein [Paenibacillus sp. HWE-109]UKS27556.1 hypothetical protein LOZ80_00975 [Paenibacillus sp. HWE-109]
MSQFTSIILIQANSSKVIKKTVKFLELKNTSAYLIETNQGWVAVAVENQDQYGGILASHIAKELQTNVINFMGSTDYGWKYELFNCKDRKGSFEIDYDKNPYYTNEELVLANFEFFEELPIEKMSFTKMKEILYQAVYEEERILEVLDLFINTLRIEKLVGFSFEALSNDSIVKDDIVYIGSKEDKK